MPYFTVIGRYEWDLDELSPSIGIYKCKDGVEAGQMFGRDLLGDEHDKLITEAHEDQEPSGINVHYIIKSDSQMICDLDGMYRHDGLWFGIGRDLSQDTNGLAAPFRLLSRAIRNEGDFITDKYRYLEEWPSVEEKPKDVYP